jgi:hypothetical protein
VRAHEDGYSFQLGGAEEGESKERNAPSMTPFTNGRPTLIAILAMTAHSFRDHGAVVQAEDRARVREGASLSEAGDEGFFDSSSSSLAGASAVEEGPTSREVEVEGAASTVGAVVSPSACSSEAAKCVVKYCPSALLPCRSDSSGLCSST